MTRNEAVVMDRLVKEADSLRGEVAALTRKLAVDERELERWRHGQQIEGDFICPNRLLLDQTRRALADLLESMNSNADNGDDRMGGSWGIEEEAKAHEVLEMKP